MTTLLTNGLFELKMEVFVPKFMAIDWINTKQLFYSIERNIIQICNYIIIMIM